MINKTWKVHAPNRGEPVFEHETLEAARKEAERLAAKIKQPLFIYEVVETVKPPPPVNVRLIQWLTSGDRDLSSESMVRAYMKLGPMEGYKFYDFPRYSSNFGRCYRLLKLAPEIKKGFPELASNHPVWKALLESWGELEALYLRDLELGSSKEFYDLIKSIRKEALNKEFKKAAIII